jgi:hypothetical protein
VHAVPLLASQAPAPLQSSAPLHSVPGSVLAGTGEQVPALPLTLQAMQVPVQVVSQHTLSMQLLLSHWPLPLHPLPLVSLQAPAPQVMAPAQSLSGSVPGVTSAQVPLAEPVLAMLHARQAPAHEVLQQKPSTQLPLSHCELMVHAEPCGSSQAPAPLQSSGLVHSLSGSEPEMIGPQVPLVP